MWICTRSGEEFIPWLGSPKHYITFIINKWGKWNTGDSWRETTSSNLFENNFQPFVFMSFFQQPGHHSLTWYPVHWFLAFTKSILLACIFAMYPPSLPSYFSGEVNTISLATAGWCVLFSQVQGDGRLGCLASAHLNSQCVTRCSWTPNYYEPGESGSIIWMEN